MSNSVRRDPNIAIQLLLVKMLASKMCLARKSVKTLNFHLLRLFAGKNVLNSLSNVIRTATQPTMSAGGSILEKNATTLASAPRCAPRHNSNAGG